jgi:hypothetical protein
VFQILVNNIRLWNEVRSLAAPRRMESGEDGMNETVLVTLRAFDCADSHIAENPAQAA